MSVNTTAHAHIEAAQDYVDKAIAEISRVIVDKVWGYEEYSHEYVNNLFKAMTQLHEIKGLMQP